MNENLINYINLEEISNKQIKYSNGNFNVIKICKHFKNNMYFLTLTLVDVEYLKSILGLSKALSHLDIIRNYSDEDYIEYCYKQQNINKINIPTYVIKIQNPLLRDDSCHDFKVLYGANKFINSYKLENNYFAVKTSEAKNINDIPFPTAIQSLRVCFLNSFDEQETQLEYVRQYKKYCEKLISKANEIIENKKDQ